MQINLFTHSIRRSKLNYHFLLGRRTINQQQFAFLCFNVESVALITCAFGKGSRRGIAWEWKKSPRKCWAARVKMLSASAKASNRTEEILIAASSLSSAQKGKRWVIEKKTSCWWSTAVSCRLAVESNGIHDEVLRGRVNFKLTQEVIPKKIVEKPATKKKTLDSTLKSSIKLIALIFRGF